MKHIKLFGNFAKLNEVAGSNIKSHIQSIPLGELHRFSDVGSFKQTQTFPVATFAYMKDLSTEVREKIKDFVNQKAKGIITNVCFPVVNTDGTVMDKSKFLVFYTNFDKAPEMYGKEQLIYEEEIFNNTDIPTSSLKDYIDGWNRHS